MNMEGLNRFVLAVIVCLALALYVAVMADGMTEFAARFSRKRRGRQKPRNRRFRKGKRERPSTREQVRAKAILSERHDPKTSK